MSVELEIKVKALVDAVNKINRDKKNINELDENQGDIEGLVVAAYNSVKKKTEKISFPDFTSQSSLRRYLSSELLQESDGLIYRIYENSLFEFAGGFVGGVFQCSSFEVEFAAVKWIKVVGEFTIPIKNRQYQLHKHLNNNDPTKLATRQNNDIVYNVQWSATEVWGMAMCIDETKSADDKTAWNVINAIEDIPLI